MDLLGVFVDVFYSRYFDTGTPPIPGEEFNRAQHMHALPTYYTPQGTPMYCTYEATNGTPKGP